VNIGVDARSLGPLKTGIGTYVSEVLRHWPASRPTDSFALFSHQSIGYAETSAVRHSVSPARWGLPWYLLHAHRGISSSALALFWGTQGLLPLGLPKSLPAVITIHDCIHRLGIRYAPSLSYNWVHRGLLPSAVRRASRILVVSRFVADEVMRYFRVPASKVEVTPLGVRPEFFGLAKSSRDGDSGIKRESDERNQDEAPVLARYQITAPFILGVGTLEPRKNLKTLLQAFALLPPRLQSQYQLVLAGKPGWGTAKLQRYLQSYPLRSRLVLTGYVSEVDLRELYAAAEMFVFPSFYEGFGLPVLEALASGCPVIASTAASLKEVAGSAAVFVDPHSPPEEWSRAIARVAESAELRHSLSVAGREQARRFSWESCAQLTSEVLRSVAEGRA
jgi:glycosyltransferase involved in cell wall biosynthesis